MSLTWQIILGPLPLFQTASNGKEGKAWEWGYAETMCGIFPLANILEIIWFA